MKVAISGKREISFKTKLMCFNLGKLIGKLNHNLICGGAKGVDYWVSKGFLASKSDRSLNIIIPIDKNNGMNILLPKIYRKLVESNRGRVSVYKTIHEPYFSIKQQFALRNEDIVANSDVCIVAGKIGIGSQYFWEYGIKMRKSLIHLTNESVSKKFGRIVSNDIRKLYKEVRSFSKVEIV